MAVLCRTGLIPWGMTKTLGSLWGGGYGRSDSSGCQEESRTVGSQRQATSRRHRIQTHENEPCCPLTVLAIILKMTEMTMSSCFMLTHQTGVRVLKTTKCNIQVRTCFWTKQIWHNREHSDDKNAITYWPGVDEWCVSTSIYRTSEKPKHMIWALPSYWCWRHHYQLGGEATSSHPYTRLTQWWVQLSIMICHPVFITSNQ